MKKQEQKNILTSNMRLQRTIHPFSETRTVNVFWNEFKDSGGIISCKTIIEHKHEVHTIITKASCINGRQISAILFKVHASNEALKVISRGYFAPGGNSKVLDAGNLRLPLEKKDTWDDFLKDHHQRIVSNYMAELGQNPEKYKIVHWAGQTD